MKRALFAVLLVFVARGALACSCMGPATVEQALDQSHAVFAGVVDTIGGPLDGRTMGTHQRDVTFRVMQWWRSDRETGQYVVVMTGSGGGDCGYPVQEGQSFLVYARRATNGSLTMSICSKTAALICAMKDLKTLGSPIVSYEAIDRETLIAREQPYTAYWRECIRPAELIGAHGLKMDRHCRYSVEGTIGTDGAVRDFRILRRPTLIQCPEYLDAQVTARVAGWRFHPASINGVPVETKLTNISMTDPRECKE